MPLKMRLRAKKSCGLVSDGLCMAGRERTTLTTTSTPRSTLSRPMMWAIHVANVVVSSVVVLQLYWSAFAVRVRLYLLHAPQQPGQLLPVALHNQFLSSAELFQLHKSSHHSQRIPQNYMKKLTYSFANTPLKAAQPPLAIANTIHCDFLLEFSISSASLGAGELSSDALEGCSPDRALGSAESSRGVRVSVWESDIIGRPPLDLERELEEDLALEKGDDVGGLEEFESGRWRRLGILDVFCGRSEARGGTIRHKFIRDYTRNIQILTCVFRV